MGQRAGEERVRSFIAFEINDPKILTGIEELQRDIIQSGSNIRTVSTRNLHITLSFLGEVPKVTIDRVTAELNQIDFVPFDISLRGIGAFPNIRRINVVWVGIDKGREDL
ncbi:RNA 2',3'-cyclic phosphodiesterase, partial [Candidatus Bathyarchaeota archaeon]|nr:RNA 2',3'-cyclic phosphodiesterase [Candidatus Bathyarchaeota archaeon]